jgi:hypothetical protein
MLRSLVAYVVNRLCILLFVLFLIRAHGAPKGQMEDVLKDWIDNISPFEKIAHALH